MITYKLKTRVNDDCYKRRDKLIRYSANANTANVRTSRRLCVIYYILNLIRGRQQRYLINEDYKSALLFLLNIYSTNPFLLTLPCVCYVHFHAYIYKCNCRSQVHVGELQIELSHNHIEYSL